MLVEVVHTTIFISNGFDYPEYVPMWYPLDTTLLVFLAHLIAQVVERIIATVLVGSYDEIGRGFPFIAVVIIVCQWLYGIASFCILQTYVIKYIKVVQSLVEIAFTVAVYFLLPYISQRVYNKYKPTGSRAPSKTRARPYASLSLRYETFENLKAATITAKITVIQIITNILTFLLHAWGKNMQRNTFEWLITMKAIHGIIYASAISQQVIVLMELSYGERQIVPCKVEPLSVEKQQNLYFEQYSNQWNMQMKT
ncbi:unnamed protein product [Bursaphelenchus xylophilus]|uniref:(pine wood nematode) hypothetical protein n=1 Tax=Bursaphelenchus xylophilus TaxID=6326 RepID=A0A1I7SS54_BURXY|nr:unnamed protein product [Bursaphelenchus xylophilus]CAG9105650.1 unnamed protein product [Bursaphelenchus xylophilus]